MANILSNFEGWGPTGSCLYKKKCIIRWMIGLRETVWKFLGSKEAIYRKMPVLSPPGYKPIVTWFYCSTYCSHLIGKKFVGKKWRIFADENFKIVLFCNNFSCRSKVLGSLRPKSDLLRIYSVWDPTYSRK